MAQIKKKFLASNAVDGAKLQFSNNEAFRAKSSSGVDVEIFKLDNSNIFQFLQLPRVGSDPSNSNDVSRKSYVDAQVLAEAAARVQADAAEQAAREAAIAAEASARQAADAALQSALNQEVSDRQAAVSAEETRAKAAEDALEASIASEESRALAAEAVLQAAIDALDTGNAQALAQEVADRQAADTTLQNHIDAEKARIDAILLASDADKDSFKEIVDLINSVDTTNDNAFASYVLSNNAALAQEVSDRQAGDSALSASLDAEVLRATGAESTLQSHIDAEQSAREAAVSAEASARQAADSSLQSALNQEVSDRQSAVSAEQSARQAADGELQDNIDAEQAARIAAVSGEEAARMAADSAIQSELDATQGGAGLETNGSYTAPVGSQYLGSAVSLKDADSKLDAAILAEVNARTTSVANLEQSIADLDAAMTQGFDEAHSYTDQKVADLINGAPAVLDTLKELADAIGDDKDFAANIMTSISNEASARQAADTAEAQARAAADSSEASARQAADTTLQNNLNSEAATRAAADSAESAARIAELPRHAKVRYTLSSTDVSNGYVDLDHIVLANSAHVFIDRLACHESDDYTLSTVSNKTRVTFMNAFKASEEGPGVGDLFRCVYAYKNADQFAVDPGTGGGGGDPGTGGDPNDLNNNGIPDDMEGDPGTGGGGGDPTPSLELLSVTMSSASWTPFTDVGMVAIEAYAGGMWTPEAYIMSGGDGSLSGTFNSGVEYRIAEYVSGSLNRISNTVVSTVE